MTDKQVVELIVKKHASILAGEVCRVIEVTIPKAENLDLLKSLAKDKIHENFRSVSRSLLFSLYGRDRLDVIFDKKYR